MVCMDSSLAERPRQSSTHLRTLAASATRFSMFAITFARPSLAFCLRVSRSASSPNSPFG